MATAQPVTYGCIVTNIGDPSPLLTDEKSGPGKRYYLPPLPISFKLFLCGAEAMDQGLGGGPKGGKRRNKAGVGNREMTFQTDQDI